NTKIVLDETTPSASSTLSFAGEFSSAATIFGTDGGTADYSLVLSGEGIGSGLYGLDATNSTAGSFGKGQEIKLYTNSNGVIEGRTGSAGGTLYFTVSVSSAGSITFTQARNIWHSDTANADEPALLNPASGSLKLRQTLTDTDGDTSSVDFDLGANGSLAIEDDAPDARRIDGNVSTAQTTPLVLEVDETLGKNDPADTVADRISSKDLSTMFAAVGETVDGSGDYGTDGAGSVAYTLSLTDGTNAQNNVGSGLFALDPSAPNGKGPEILLSVDSNGDVVGTATVGNTNSTYFTISVSSAGLITFSQSLSLNIWHPTAGSTNELATLTLNNGSGSGLRALRLTQTVIDRDGDRSSAYVDLATTSTDSSEAAVASFQIRDDGPTNSAKLNNAIVSNQTDFQTNANFDPTAVEVDFSASFTSNFGTDGAADTDSISYALSISANGIGSGVFSYDSTQTSNKGAEILLYNNNGVVEGKTSSTGAVFFTLSVDGTNGKVTLNQAQGQRLWMDNSGTAVVTTAAITDVRLSQTIKDADEDTSVAQLDLGQGAITFTEVEIPTIWVSDVHVNEGDGTLTFVINRKTTDGSQDFLDGNAGSTTVSTINYEILSTGDDDATGGGVDYTHATGLQSLVFDGTDTMSVTVDIEQDTIYEKVEQFTIRLSTVANGNAVISTRLANGYIHDDGTRDGTISGPDDDRPTLEVVGGTVEEGSSAVYTVNLSNAIAEPTLIDLDISNVSTEDGDYETTYEWFDGTSWNTVPQNGQILLPAELTSFDVRVSTTSDDIYEGVEKLNLKATFVDPDLNGESGNADYSITDNGTGTDGDDDTDNDNDPSDADETVDDDRPSLVVTGGVVEEGSSAVYQVEMTRQTEAATLIDLGLTNVSTEVGDYNPNYYWSLNGTDWTAVAGNQVSLPALETVFFVRVDTINDGEFEKSEDLKLTATFNAAELKFADRTGSSTNMRAGATANADYSITDDGSGVDGNDDTDAVPNDGTDNDKTVDDDRPISVTGYGPVNEASDWSLFKVNAAVGYTVYLDILSEQTTLNNSNATIEYYDATNGWTSYDTTNGLNYPGGGLTSDLWVRVNITAEQDNVYEKSETFSLKASYATNPTKYASGSTNIVDGGNGVIYPDQPPGTNPPASPTGLDDDRPKFTVDDVTVNEAVGTMTFTVTKTGDTATGLNSSVDYALSSGTATVGVDTDTPSGTLTFKPGEITKTITVAVVNDTAFERKESFNVKLTNAVESKVQDGTGVGTIWDDGTGNSSFNTDPSDPTYGDATGTGVNDDRPLTVTGYGPINENSDWGMFKISAAVGYTLNLEILAEQTNFSNSTPLQYLDNGVWKPYNPATGVVVPGSGLTTDLWIRVDITSEQDSPWEVSETFSLKASYDTNPGKTAQAQTSIVDTGDGRRYEPQPGNPTYSSGFQLDDDRPGFSTTPPPPPEVVVQDYNPPERPPEVDAYVLDAVREARDSLNAVALADAMETDAQGVIDNLTGGIALYVLPAVDEARSETIELFRRLSSDTGNQIYSSVLERSSLFETTPFGEFDPAREGTAYGSSVDARPVNGAVDAFGGSSGDDEELRRSAFGDLLSSLSQMDGEPGEELEAHQGLTQQLGARSGKVDEVFGMLETSAGATELESAAEVAAKTQKLSV
ncbi:MAG: hypothetical protein HWE12_12565, partial [Oceanospirillaceae bacterium]|nr:hypothetical protein [Oceanospirillaceae bacterium]